ncbi:mobile element protein [Microcystis sp. 0824]|nr:mobile element protein [Microcystis sp. 0824]
MTIKRAKELVQNSEMEEIEVKEREKRAELNLEGYTWKEEKVTYGGIQQIWLIVTSEKRQISDLKKLENNLKKEKDKMERILKSLQKEELKIPNKPDIN